MTFPIRFWAVLLIFLLALQYSTDASADWCKYEQEFNLTLDLAESDELAITAVAGDLEVIGVAGSNQAVIHGKACVSKKAWLESANVEARPGKRAEISASLSDSNGSGFCFGVCYRSLDLRIEVPDNMALDVRDSSGDIYVRNTADLELKDSSGDIEIEDARGSVFVRDSSGDIEIDTISGDFIVRADSSGDIYATDVDGHVLIEQDSSGDIRVSRVGKDVIVERDSSGDIAAKQVGGDFRVLKDSSGSIRSQDVQGEVDVPERT